MAEPTANNTKKTNDTSDGLALIVGGLFVLAMVFATYNYFNSNPAEVKKETQKEEKVEATEDEKSLTDRIKDFFEKQETEEKGDLNGEGIQTTDKTKTQETVKTTDNTTTSNENSAIWTANDYKPGDISGSSYTVKSGDTLWEIAEARYGNGAEWTKILAANSSNVGFLANGQQALIMPGQVLVLN